MLIPGVSPTSRRCLSPGYWTWIVSTNGSCSFSPSSSVISCGESSHSARSSTRSSESGLAAADRTLAEAEGLGRQIAALQAEIQGPAPSGNDSAHAANVEPTSAPAVPHEATPAPQRNDFSSRPVAGDALEFVDRHLLPNDALIARLMIGNVSPPEIARETNHSKAFVLARAVQIEKMVAGASGAPAALVRTLRQYLQDHSSVR